MNAIRKAIDEMHFRIPPQILQLVFIKKDQSWRQSQFASIDDQILNNVVRARVLVDCNLVGGSQAYIPLSGLEQIRRDDYTVIIHIPKTRTGGRTINSVLHLSYYPVNALGAGHAAGYGGSFGMYQSVENTSSMSVAQSMFAAHDKIPLTSTSSVTLVAENTICIRDSVALNPDAFLRCILSDDAELSHIQLRSYPAFVKLVEYAVKSYIYKEMIVAMDQMQLMAGQQLGVVKEIVQSYSDAEQNYQDYLRDTWEAVAFMNDDIGMDRFVGLLIGGQR